MHLTCAPAVGPAVRFRLNLAIQALVGSFSGVIVPIPQRAGTLQVVLLNNKKLRS